MRLANIPGHLSVRRAAILLITAGLLHAQTIVDDEFDKYTTVNQLGMAITNYGVLGNGYERVNGVIQPSAQYKQHTAILREQVEHFSFSGIWIGGRVKGEPRVSTSIVDGVFESGAVGFEFLPLSSISIKSSISSTAQDPMAAYFDPSAVSHQDYICRYTDVLPADRQVPEHTPLGIEVIQRSFAWNYTFADAFVIFEYNIINRSSETIEDLYAGIWVDASVANMNYTSDYEPGGGFTWYDNLDGFDITIDGAGFTRDISYQYDADGDDGWAESYIGFKTLGGSVPLGDMTTHYNQWVWVTSSNDDYPAFTMALTDPERYLQLSSSVPNTNVDPLLYKPDGYPLLTNSWLFMHSAGPFGSTTADSITWSLPPGDTAQVVFAAIAGRWADAGDDTPSRRAKLHTNADWAQKTYDGEDANRNNQLDPGEDWDEDGVLDRYILPEPPPSPAIYLDVRSQQVDIYWDRQPEDFVDPISHKKDFEGYRVYAARKTSVEEAVSDFTLLAEFDLVANGIGFDTGLESARIRNDEGEPDSVLFSGRYYHYLFKNVDVKNGWVNYYSVTAFDRGDPATNLASLESSVYSNRTIVFPGTVAEDWNDLVGVYPNPYVGSAKWDGYGSRTKRIWFQYLPPQATIRIYTLAGDLVKVIAHDASDASSFDVQAPGTSQLPKFAGGEHAWDLITRFDQEAASGMYLFTIENRVTGSPNFENVKEGKFVIIK